MTNEELVILAKENDEQALRELLQKNEGLITNIANRYAKTINDDVGFLKVVCGEVLWKCVEKYDQDKNSSFSWYIGQAMEKKLNQMYVKQNRQKRKAILEQLDMKVGICLEVHDVIPDWDAEDEFKYGEDTEFVCDVVEVFLRMATPREKGILEAIYLWGYRKQEIAEYLNVTYEYIRRIEKEIVECLRGIAKTLLEGGGKSNRTFKGCVDHVFIMTA